MECLIAASLVLLCVLLVTAPSQASPQATPTLVPAAYLPFISKGRAAVTPPPPGNWLAYVNYYRAMADLPPVTENTAYSNGDWLHARYMVKTDTVEHAENPGNPWYTPEGHAAAQASNLAASYSASVSDEWAIDAWMQAPFHAVGVLDPSLLQVGYGSYREADGGLQSGAALDVIRGLTYTVPSGIVFPIKWPADGMIVPLRLHWGESPSPLTSCPGYTAPSGLPIILEIGPGNLTPSVTGHSFIQGGAPLEHCVFDETSYSHPDPGSQSLGRSILNSRDAIVLIPRLPLTPRASYTASITVDGQTHTWTFSVSSTATSVGIQGIIEAGVTEDGPDTIVDQ
ncbi:MAG TPA: CAP domain-containing protein [Anaerolineae bacterium]|nr:CAP domain-containing protein [Anaerolineae bacterium]